MDETQKTPQDFHFDGEGLYEPITIRAIDEAKALEQWLGVRVQLPDKVVPLICTYKGCTTKIGEATFPANHPIDEKKADHTDLGFDDVRCDEHPKK